MPLKVQSTTSTTKNNQMTKTYSREQLIHLGFELPAYAETPNDFQFIADRDDYFNSPYLTTKTVPEGFIIVDGDKELSESEFQNYLKKYSAKENFTTEELRKLGFSLVPEDDFYRMVIDFEPDREDGKSLQTEPVSVESIKSGTMKVINNVNRATNGFRYLTENQIKKLVKRGGF